MKVIFLDIDGVLNVYCRGRDSYGCLFEPLFVDNLRWIIAETDAKIVISSTWRMSGLSVMKEMWSKRALPGEVIDVTPTEVELSLFKPPEFADRGYEIQQWLDDNEVEGYCIIDDDSDMLTEQNFVKTSDNFRDTEAIEGYGLTLDCAKRVVALLKS